MSRSILILGNTANAGYAVAKELVKMNVDVTLGINEKDFGMAMPEWEEGEFDTLVNPYLLDRNPMKKSWDQPKWIRPFKFEMNATIKKLPRKFIESLGVHKFLKEYDIIEAHVPFSIITQFSTTPYYSYDAGWIRHFENRRNIWDRLGERGYNKAKGVMITNPDTLRIVETIKTLHNKNISFVPFAIDHDYYKPIPKNECGFDFLDGYFVITAPARHDWKNKGNDKFIRAFARFVKKHPLARLVTTSWSDDEFASLALTYQLGIADKVIWLPPLPKKLLIKLYNKSDIILDQFILGSWGALTPEAMSCSKPVLMYFSEKYITKTFGSHPPILNSFTEEEILQNMEKLTDQDLSKNIGIESRDWVKKTHDPHLVATRHLEILSSHERK